MPITNGCLMWAEIRRTPMRLGPSPSGILPSCDSGRAHLLRDRFPIPSHPCQFSFSNRVIALHLFILPIHPFLFQSNLLIVLMPSLPIQPFLFPSNLLIATPTCGFIHAALPAFLVDSHAGTQAQAFGLMIRHLVIPCEPGSNGLTRCLIIIFIL